MWSRGDQIVVRYSNGERLSYVEPMTVVEDAADCTALYMAAGTPMKLPVTPDGSPIPRSLPYEARQRRPWRLGNGTWHSTSVLWLARPAAAHKIGVFWRDTDRQFLGWYVDLIAPLVRTAVGFDTRDHVLDLLIAPDFSWRWKDEDEFVAAQRMGRITPAEAAAIRAEGETVIDDLGHRAWPFDAGWEHWKADPSWPLPAWCDDWDAI